MPWRSQEVLTKLQRASMLAWRLRRIVSTLRLRLRSSALQHFSLLAFACLRDRDGLIFPIPL